MYRPLFASFQSGTRKTFATFSRPTFSTSLSPASNRFRKGFLFGLSFVVAYDLVALQTWINEAMVANFCFGRTKAIFDWSRDATPNVFSMVQQVLNTMLLAVITPQLSTENKLKFVAVITEGVQNAHPDRASDAGDLYLMILDQILYQKFDPAFIKGLQENYLQKILLVFPSVVGEKQSDIFCNLLWNCSRVFANVPEKRTELLHYCGSLIRATSSSPGATHKELLMALELLFACSGPSSLPLPSFVPLPFTSSSSSPSSASSYDLSPSARLPRSEEFSAFHFALRQLLEYEDRKWDLESVVEQAKLRNPGTDVLVEVRVSPLSQEVEKFYWGARCLKAAHDAVLEGRVPSSPETSMGPNLYQHLSEAPLAPSPFYPLSAVLAIGSVPFESLPIASVYASIRSFGRKSIAPLRAIAGTDRKQLRNLVLKNSAKQGLLGMLVALEYNVLTSWFSSWLDLKTQPEIERTAAGNRIREPSPALLHMLQNQGHHSLILFSVMSAFLAAQSRFALGAIVVSSLISVSVD